MHFEKYSYRFAEEVLNGKLVTRQELESIIQSIEVPAAEMSRPHLNEAFDKAFVAHGWESQHKVFPTAEGPRLTIDFLKNRVGVEVAFSHHSFIGIDLLKFQILSYSGLDKIDVGVHIVATQRFFPKKWKGSQSFERVKQYLPHFRHAIQVPVWVIGLLPSARL